MTSVVIPVRDFDVALLDLDGVVYVGQHPVVHAVASINDAQRQGMRPAYVTNNASRTPEEIAAHLSDLGLSPVAADVVTSAQAGAHALQRILDRRGERGPVLAIGGPGVAAALRERGLEVTDSADDDPVAVLQGFGRDVGWTQLAEASIAIGRGTTWVATNPDTSIPIPRGRAPGNGAFVHAVQLATGRTPDLVAGKPHRPLIDESIDRTGARRALMIGDRLDTDIEAGVTAGIPTLLVMTGITDVIDVLCSPPQRRPHLVSLDLRGLHQEFPELAKVDEQWVCGPISVAGGPHGDDICATFWRGDVAGEAGVDIDVQKSALDDPAIWSALMRCVCAAVWEREEIDPTSFVTSPVVSALQETVDRLRRISGVE